MINIKNLQKTFGKNEVLKGIDLEIEAGEVVVIIGPSGSGKSTFLRCLNLLETPTGGSVEFEGKNLLDKNQAANLQNQIDKLTATIDLGTINHKLGGFPSVRALSWDYGAGVVPVGQETTGAGGGHPQTLSINIEYLSRNSLKVKVPVDFGLVNPKYQKLDEYHHRFISGIKTIEVILGGN